jgi:hypothetical protein
MADRNRPDQEHRRDESRKQRLGIGAEDQLTEIDCALGERNGENEERQDG